MASKYCKGDVSMENRKAFWGPVSAIVVAQFLIIMNNAVINMATPAISHTYNITGAQRSWIINSYLVPFGALLLVGGSISEKLGHKRTLTGALVLFGIAAAGAGISPNIAWFVTCRCLQGMCAALMAPAALALLSITFSDSNQRSVAFSVYGLATGAAAGLGTIAGGVVTTVASWRWTLFMNLPLVLVALGAGAVWLRNVTVSPAGRWPNLFSAGLLAIGVSVSLTVLGYVTEGESIPLPSTTLMATVAVLCLVVFIRTERTSTHPLVPRDSTFNRDRIFGLIVVTVGGLGPTGFFVAMSMYLQLTYGLAASQASWVVLPYPLVMVVSSMFAPILSRRLGLRCVATLGLIVAAASCPFIATAAGSGWAWLELWLSLMAAGMALAFATGTQLAMTGVAEEESGSAGALTVAFPEIAGALGIATLVIVEGYSGFLACAILTGSVLMCGAVSEALTRTFNTKTPGTEPST
ncbi:MFS transporter [Corynebacterium bovis]|uniref:MFS transporter n=1 Tax=Corynebacterium bovis TaxID=36808 RepID=UPI0031393AAA